MGVHFNFSVYPFEVLDCHHPLISTYTLRRHFVTHVELIFLLASLSIFTLDCTHIKRLMKWYEMRSPLMSIVHICSDRYPCRARYDSSKSICRPYLTLQEPWGKIFQHQIWPILQLVAIDRRNIKVPSMSLQSYDCHSISLQVLMFLAAFLFTLTVCNCFVNGGINPDLLAEFLSGWYGVGVSKWHVLTSTLSSVITRETRCNAGVKPQKNHCKWWTLGVHLQVEKGQLRCVCDRFSRWFASCKEKWVTVKWIGLLRLRGMGSIMFLALCFACFTMRCALAQKLVVCRSSYTRGYL